MRTSARTATVVVGIFDDLHNLDLAVEKLMSEQIESTAYDEAIVAEEIGKAYAGPIPVYPGGLAAMIAQQAAAPNSPALALEFSSQLAEFQLPDEVIEAYATTFGRKGKFLLIEADTDRVDESRRSCGTHMPNE